MAKRHKQKDDPKAVYGYLLNIRALEAAAGVLWEYPAALRVLCVVAAYANEDGVCWPSQHDIAARLGMARQTVSRHLAVLDRLDLLIAAGGKGRRKKYHLNRDGLENKRWCQDDVDESRAARKMAKKGKFNPAAVRKKPAPVEPTPAKDEPAEIVQSAPVEPTSPATPPLGDPFDPLDIDWALIGDAVYHHKFGNGVVVGLSSDKPPNLIVRFDHGGERAVLAHFVRPILNARWQGAAGTAFG